MFHLVECSNLLAHFPVGVLLQTTSLLLFLRYLSEPGTQAIYPSMNAMFIDWNLCSLFDFHLWWTRKIKLLNDNIVEISLLSEGKYARFEVWKFDFINIYSDKFVEEMMESCLHIRYQILMFITKLL